MTDTKGPRQEKDLAPEYIFVVGPFSSGTTAVTGVILNLGGQILGPLSRTNDPRTESSLESVPFQAICDELVCPERLHFHDQKRTRVLPLLLGLKQQITALKSQEPAGSAQPIIFKRATTAFFLQEIKIVFNPRFVFVRRDLDHIEQTRTRRGWYESHGKRGAKIIFSQMNSFSRSHPTTEINFQELRDNPLETVKQLSIELGLSPSNEMIQNAASWITDHKTRFGS